MVETETQTRACSDCTYWKNLDGKEGECRVHAPQTIVFEVDEVTKFETRFPVTKGEDWCGEFKQR